jgi:hypothetical protein
VQAVVAVAAGGDPVQELDIPSGINLVFIKAQ